MNKQGNEHGHRARLPRLQLQGFPLRYKDEQISSTPGAQDQCTQASDEGAQCDALEVWEG